MSHRQHDVHVTRSLREMHRRLDRIERRLNMLLVAASIEFEQEEYVMGAVEDLAAQVDSLEASQEANSQAIKDAASRTSADLSALNAEVQDLEAQIAAGANPDVSAITARIAAVASGISEVTQLAATIDPTTPDPAPVPDPTPTPEPPAPEPPAV